MDFSWTGSNVYIPNVGGTINLPGGLGQVTIGGGQTQCPAGTVLNTDGKCYSTQSTAGGSNMLILIVVIVAAFLFIRNK